MDEDIRGVLRLDFQRRIRAGARAGKKFGAGNLLDLDRRAPVAGAHTLAEQQLELLPRPESRCRHPRPGHENRARHQAFPGRRVLPLACCRYGSCAPRASASLATLRHRPPSPVHRSSGWTRRREAATADPFHRAPRVGRRRDCRATVVWRRGVRLVVTKGPRSGQDQRAVNHPKARRPARRFRQPRQDIVVLAPRASPVPGKSTAQRRGSDPVMCRHLVRYFGRTGQTGRLLQRNRQLEPSVILGWGWGAGSFRRR